MEHIRESEEMYLKTIYLLKQGHKVVRAINIIKELEYAKSSVSKAMKLLKEKNLIYTLDNGSIEFTENGFKKAKEVNDKHVLITKMLMDFGLNEKIAKKDACKIEHVISPEFFNLIKEKYS